MKKSLVSFLFLAFSTTVLAEDYLIIGDSIALGNPFCGGQYADPHFVSQAAAHATEFRPNTGSFVPVNLNMQYLRVGLSLTPLYTAYLGRDIRIMKTALDGTTSQQWATELLTQTLQYTQQTRFSPLIVFVSLGTNDALFNVPVERTVRYLSQIDATLRKRFPRATIVYDKIPSAGRINQVYPAIYETINSTFDRLAAFSPLTVAVENNAQLETDQIHPTCQGEAQIAMAITQILSGIK